MTMTHEPLRSGPLPDVTLDDLERDPELERLTQDTLAARLKLSFSDMREATRRLIDENPTEPRLLFFVLMSDVIFFLNFGLKFVISPTGDSMSEALPREFAGAIGGLIVVCFILRTASLYVLSALVAGACRLIGGQGTWRDTRAGIFWASLVAAPIGVLGALVVTAFGYLAPIAPIFGEPILQMPAQLIGVVAFVFLVSAAVAEAHRFSRTSPVFISFSVFTVAVLLAALYVWGYVRDAL
ncbi:MAG: Yip1 family protein [Pseudomonadota bacterium]